MAMQQVCYQHSSYLKRCPNQSESEATVEDEELTSEDDDDEDGRCSQTRQQ